MQKVIRKENRISKEVKPYLKIQRTLDLMVSSLLLIILFPLLLTLSMAVLLFSGRPIFFKQTRTGINNKPFTIWKFRTMTNRKEQEENVYEWNEEVPNDFVFKSASDCRVTGIGQFFRKYSIDEVPQLINVLRGEMSIVGPRPEIPEITKYYNAYQIQRLKMRPGITGYAQINGRSDVNHGEKIKLDRHYVDNCSLLLDFKIIVKTVGVVLKGRGSY